MTTIEKLQMLAEMQDKVQKMKNSKGFTKQDLCDVCVPVRDQLRLTDRETLSVANNTATLSDIVLMLSKTPDDLTSERLQVERINAYYTFADTFKQMYPKSTATVYQDPDIDAVVSNLVAEAEDMAS